MIIFANTLSGIAEVLSIVLKLYTFLLIFRALISWVSPDPFNPIVKFLTGSTEPILQPLRRLIPPLGGRIDLTPIVALLLLVFLEAAVVTTLKDYAVKTRTQALIGGEK